MKIHIRARSVHVTDVLRNHVVRQLGLTLGRFGGSVTRVKCALSGTGCEVEAVLSPGRVLAHDRDPDLFVAVDHAAARLGRSVGRALEHGQDPPRAKERS